MKLHATFFLMTIFTLPLLAQDALPAVGGDAAGSGGTASYSVGQVIYTTLTSSTGSATQGVQQAYIIDISTGIEEHGIQLMVSAYPNPTTGLLHLTIDASEDRALSFRLYDIEGKLMTVSQLYEPTTTIPMQEMAAATYMLVVNDNEKTIKTFKIIKTK